VDGECRPGTEPITETSLMTHVFFVDNYRPFGDDTPIDVTVPVASTPPHVH
jgi:hypothetical protein